MAACAAPIVRTPKEEVAEFPLIDAHSHYVPKAMSDYGYTPEELLKAMDIAGIRRMVVLGFGPGVSQLARQKPSRFVASYVGDFSFRFRQARGEIKDGTTPTEVERISVEFEKALKSGLYQGIGEIHTYADPWIPFLPGANIAPDSPLINRLLHLAGRYGMPINIHCTSTGVEKMARSLRAHPKTLVVWAHTGSYLSPSAISDILREYPNVFFDLSSKNPACCPAGYSQNHPLMGIRSINENWRQLFEAYPHRFLVGVDFLSSNHLFYAREAGEFYRTILGHLMPATARKIGYQNAQRLYGLS
jgi:Tat protein secretion system quality control protein TatD with DNase activity